MRHLRVRCDSDVVGTETTIKPHQSFILDNLLGAVDEALVRVRAIGSFRLLLESGLNEVKG